MAKASSPAGSATPQIPFQAFRLVFGLANGALWFLLAGGILTAITAAMAASGRLTAMSATVTATAVAFFVCFFGMPGALGGFLGQARLGRIALPPRDQWGRGALGPIHRIAFWHGAISALLVAPAAFYYFADGGAPARGTLCLLVGGEAAALAFIHCALLAGSRALGDIHPGSRPPPAPTRQYYWRRFAIPQGAGNGLITALVAAGTYPPPGTPLDARALVLDATATAIIIGGFMLVTGGGLAGVDRTYGLVAGILGPPPSWRRRIQLLVAAVAVAAGAAFVLGLIAGARGLPLPAFIAWKGLVGAATGGVIAVFAARVVLAKPAA